MGALFFRYGRFIRDEYFTRDEGRDLLDRLHARGCGNVIGGALKSAD
jgi:hypothetical protein